MKLLTKIICIFVLILILQIPLLFLGGLIGERKDYKNDVVRQISRNFGGSQLIITPTVELQYEALLLNDQTGTTATSHQTISLLPEKLVVNGNMDVERKNRRIYSVAVFKSNINMEGNFHPAKNVEEKIQYDGYEYRLASIRLNMNVSDKKGLKSIPKIIFDGQEYSFQMDSVNKNRNLFVELPLDTLQAADWPFTIHLSVNGTQSLMFFPTGIESTIHLKGNWPHPSFQGGLLPETRDVTDSGFTATWFSSAFSRAKDFNLDEFGVNLIQIVDIYSLVDRSIKYGFLIISLTFLIIFMLEMVLKRRIHPIQYGLVGFALVVFFLLLLSLAERVGFAAAYTAAALACTALITFYIYFALKKVKITAVFSLFLLILYALIYMLLNISEYALVIGSVFLFFVLAAVMIVTREFDWYGTKE